jgi:hypothetical protein
VETSVKALLILGLTLMVSVPARTSLAQAPARQACDVQVDVTDDPKGANVRSAPSGAVIAVLKNPGAGWIEAHITGQLGDWYETDRAKLIDPDMPSGEKVLFRGKGYLHKSVLGLSGMQNGAAILTNHDLKSRPVDAHAAGDQPVDLLGCWGDFLKVRVKKGVGWTEAACTNTNTTCA